MAYRDLLNASGKISAQFLPAGEVTNPLTDNLDCAGNELINVQSVAGSTGNDLRVAALGEQDVILETNNLNTLIASGNGDVTIVRGNLVAFNVISPDGDDMYVKATGNTKVRFASNNTDIAYVDTSGIVVESGYTYQVDGLGGLSQVYDVLYNPPPRMTLVKEYDTIYESSTDTTTFEVNTDGMYLIQVIFNSTGATVPNDNTKVVAAALAYGDEAHSAELVPNANVRATAFMIPDIAADYDTLSLSCFVQLQSNVYEPNQRYAIKTYADSGYANGSLRVEVYRMN